MFLFNLSACFTESLLLEYNVETCNFSNKSCIIKTLKHQKASVYLKIISFDFCLFFFWHFALYCTPEKIKVASTEHVVFVLLILREAILYNDTHTEETHSTVKDTQLHTRPIIPFTLHLSSADMHRHFGKVFLGR